MDLVCKINVQCFGYVNTKPEPVSLVSGKTYTLEKNYDTVLKANYYKVKDNNKLITTISENEFEVFFK